MVGHETSAGVLNYTLHSLASNQSAQDKLRTELSVAGFTAYSFAHGDEGEGREPTYDELMDPRTLPYLDAVAKEGWVYFSSLCFGLHFAVSVPFGRLFRFVERGAARCFSLTLWRLIFAWLPPEIVSLILVLIRA